MTTTVADLLVDRLIEWGVDTVFSLPGDGINGIFEALRLRQDRIKMIQVRHEEAAAFAACGYAKFSRRLGVCLATSGPGGLHLLNGLYDAKCDGQPVLAITGHTFHDLIGTHYQQDVDLDKVFSDVAAYNERVMGPAHVCNVVDEAVKTAVAKRTVAICMTRSVSRRRRCCCARKPASCGRGSIATSGWRRKGVMRWPWKRANGLAESCRPMPAKPYGQVSLIKTRQGASSSG